MSTSKQIRPCRIPVVAMGMMGLFLTHPAWANQIVFSASKDTSIYADLTSNSSGAGQFLISGVNKSGNTRRSLIAFDFIGTIPADATINFARLTLTIAKSPDETPVATTQRLHRATTDWGIANSGGTGNGAPAEPNDATWLQNFFGHSNWSQPGGDFVPTESASAFVPPTINATITWSTLTLAADIQGWLTNPSENFGWMILGNEAFTSNARGYYSMDNSSVTNRPQLLVDFTPIPEPSTAMFLLGSLMLLACARNRKKQLLP